MTFLNEYYHSRKFGKYCVSKGVQEYQYFAGLPDNYEFTLADAGFALLESLGADACKELGVECSSGFILDHGEPVGRSMLMAGKARKGITVAMWLEDFGHFGVSIKDLRDEMDGRFGEGWFYDNVERHASRKLMESNRVRQLKEYFNGSSELTSTSSLYQPTPLRAIAPPPRSIAQRLVGWFLRLFKVCQPLPNCK